MKKVTFCILFVSVMLFMSEGVHQAAGKKPLIQMAILLDTSGSMEGLIEQAKTQLWKIVNEMATAKKNRQIPRLEVGLYEYGKSTIPASEGYLRMIVPLNEDLDCISEELFKLRTNGGDEYCGKVIRAATSGLSWSRSNDDYKVIFIAGNEPFSQGDVDYRIACKEAISREIIVNTIFCGNFSEGIQTLWKDGADLADGRYMNIDQNQKIVHVSAPQDQEIIELGKKLNQTYIAYGRSGTEKKERQKEQDKNALSVNAEVMVQRSVAKASPQYRNVGWDLVDAIGEGKLNIGDLKSEDLPAEMRKMDDQQKNRYIDEKKKQREEIQKRISQLQKAREKYVSDKRKEMSAAQTLDEALISAVKEQAAKKKFDFHKK